MSFYFISIYRMMHWRRLELLACCIVLFIVSNWKRSEILCASAMIVPIPSELYIYIYIWMASITI